MTSVVCQKLTKNVINTYILAWLPGTTWVLKVYQTIFSGVGAYTESDNTLCLKKGLARETNVIGSLTYRHLVFR